MVTLSNAAAITVTLPQQRRQSPSRSVPRSTSSGSVSDNPRFAAGSGATVNATPGLKLRARYSAATAKKIATNDWVVIGDLAV